MHTHTYTCTYTQGWKGRMFLTCVSFGDYIYVMGGHDGKNYLHDVWSSSDDGATWTEVCSNASWGGRQGHSVVVMSPQVSIRVIYLDLEGAIPLV